jgi:hypothetical protein
VDQRISKKNAILCLQCKQTDTAAVVTIINWGEDSGDSDAGTKAHEARGCGLLMMVCRCIDDKLHSRDGDTN